MPNLFKKRLEEIDNKSHVSNSDASARSRGRDSGIIVPEPPPAKIVKKELKKIEAKPKEELVEEFLSEESVPEEEEEELDTDEIFEYIEELKSEISKLKNGKTESKNESWMVSGLKMIALPAIPLLIKMGIQMASHQIQQQQFSTTTSVPLSTQENSCPKMSFEQLQKQRKF